MSERILCFLQMGNQIFHLFLLWRRCCHNSFQYDMMNLTGSLFQGCDDHKLTLWKSAGSKNLSSIVLLDKNIQGMNIESLPVWFVKSHTFHNPLQK